LPLVEGGTSVEKIREYLQNVDNAGSKAFVLNIKLFIMTESGIYNQVDLGPYSLKNTLIPDRMFLKVV